MFSSLTGFEGGLFEDFRRLQEEIDNLFDQWPATTGVRSVARGTFPPINVGATPRPPRDLPLRCWPRSEEDRAFDAAEPAYRDRRTGVAAERGGDLLPPRALHR